MKLEHVDCGQRSCGFLCALYRSYPPIATHFSVARSICLSVVCHISTPCLNPFTYLDTMTCVVETPSQYAILYCCLT